MKKHGRIIASTLVVAISALVLTCVLSFPTRAEDDNATSFNESYFKKHTGIANLYKCYDGHMESPVVIDTDNQRNDAGTYLDLRSLAKNDNATVAAVPNYLFGDVTTLTCQEFLAGKGSYGGLTSISSVGSAPSRFTSTPEQQGQFLQKLGYVGSNNDDTRKQCGRIEYSVAHYTASTPDNLSMDNYKTVSICAEVDSEGKLKSSTLTTEGDAINLPKAGENDLISPINFGNDRGGLGYVSANGGSATVTCSIGEAFDPTCMDRISNALPDVISVQDPDYPTTMGQVRFTRIGPSDITSNSTSLGTEFVLNGNSAKNGASNIFGSTRNTFPTVAERASLYQLYLNHDAESMYCSVPDDKVATLTSSGYIDKAIKLVKNGKVYSNCYVKASDKTYIGFDGTNWYAEVSLNDILDFLASNEVPSDWASYVVSANATIYGEEDTSGYATGPTATSDEVDCFNAAGSLGFILCPIIEFTQNTITAVYSSIVENFLEFRAEWLNISGAGSSVYAAWQTFQSFANIAFVIVLLVVIFSQLTGVGIDNLGIKRVLPKLIIAAILINLSYFICMLAVDVSNILGVGFNDLFSNMVVTIDSTASANGAGAAVFATVVTGAVAGAVGFLAVNAGLLGIVGSFVVIPLVIGLITTLIGILFFFVLLGARQAGIIMLVVVSPVAFAAYMLPNTKTFFDKWLKAFEGLLLLFPICGIIMGGSAFASKILMTVDLGFLGNLVAMLVGVVPFFFIPGLLRSAFAAMGNIGARISGAGQRLGRGLAGMAGRSDALKETQTRMAAGIKRNGDLSWSGKRRAATARGETLMGKVPGVRRRASLSQARSWAAYEKMQDELDLASRPELIRSEAETRRFGRRQAAEDAILVNSGVANRTGDVKDFKSASQFEEGTLAFAAMQAAHSGNDAAQYAITERMLASGHHGAEAYRQVLQALEQEGNTKALSNFARAGKNSRHTADLKSGARSTFDYINAVTDGKVIDGNSIRPGHQLQDYVEKTKFANMSEAQLFNTDNEELSRYFSYVKDKRASIAAATEQKQQELGRELTAEERDDVYKQQFASEGERQQYEALVSQATNAYNNVRLRGNAKESRQNLVADIAGIPEDKRVTSGSNQINIDHSKNQGNAGGGNADTGTGGAGNNTGGSTGTNNSTPAVTEETLQQMAQQYNNQSGYSNRGNVSDEDIQRNINRLRSKANPSLQEMEMLNRLYNEQGTRQNLRQANQNANNSGSSSPRPNPSNSPANPSTNRGAGTPV